MSAKKPLEYYKLVVTILCMTYLWRHNNCARRWRWDTGKISVNEEISIENPRKKKTTKDICWWISI